MVDMYRRLGGTSKALRTQQFRAHGLRKKACCDIGDDLRCPPGCKKIFTSRDKALFHLHTAARNCRRRMYAGRLIGIVWSSCVTSLLNFVFHACPSQVWLSGEGRSVRVSSCHPCAILDSRHRFHFVKERENNLSRSSHRRLSADPVHPVMERGLSSFFSSTSQPVSEFLQSLGLMSIKVFRNTGRTRPSRLSLGNEHVRGSDASRHLLDFAAELRTVYASVLAPSNDLRRLSDGSRTPTHPDVNAAHLSRRPRSTPLPTSTSICWLESQAPHCPLDEITPHEHDTSPTWFDYPEGRREEVAGKMAGSTGGGTAGWSHSSTAGLAALRQVARHLASVQVVTSYFAMREHDGVAFRCCPTQAAPSTGCADALHA